MQIDHTGARDHKQAAIEFLEFVVAGRIDEAYDRHVLPAGKHHNSYFAAGFPALRKAMKEAHLQFPNKRFTIKNVLADGDLVAVHSHMVLKPGEAGLITLHLFRFQNEKIAEMWDFCAAIPADSPNTDGRSERPGLLVRRSNLN